MKVKSLRSVCTKLVTLGATIVSLQAAANCELEIQSDWQSGFLAKVNFENTTDNRLENWSFDLFTSHKTIKINKR